MESVLAGRAAGLAAFEKSEEAEGCLILHIMERKFFIEKWERGNRFFFCTEIPRLPKCSSSFCRSIRQTVQGSKYPGGGMHRKPGQQDPFYGL